MVRPDTGSKHAMSAVEFDTLHRDNMRSLVRKRASRRGVDVIQARAEVARELAVSPSKVERVEKGRFKTATAFLFDRVRGLVIREIEHEISRLSHHRQVLMQSGVVSHSIKVGEVDARLNELRDLLGLEVRDGP